MEQSTFARQSPVAVESIVREVPVGITFGEQTKLERNLAEKVEDG